MITILYARSSSRWTWRRWVAYTINDGGFVGSAGVGLTQASATRRLFRYHDAVTVALDAKERENA